MQTKSDPPGGPCILIVATCDWGHMARLALEFVEAGCAVSCLSSASHPMWSITAIETRLRHSVARPITTLQRAIRRIRPDLIIPGDDRAVRQLQRLYVRLRRAKGQGCRKQNGHRAVIGYAGWLQDGAFTPSAPIAGGAPRHPRAGLCAGAQPCRPRRMA
jgi:hypothetical protein